jgi:hypothetical protein
MTAREESQPPTEFWIRQRDDDRKALGDAAEIMVLAYERARVGTDLANRVNHVATTNPAAGYDISSVTRAPQNLEPRYIEVKAVSAVTFEFFWTENEVNVARLLGSYYFLYLVPVITDGQFLMEQLRIVRDAYATVLGTSAFAVESNVRRCRLIQVDAYEEK